MMESSYLSGIKRRIRRDTSIPMSTFAHLYKKIHPYRAGILLSSLIFLIIFILNRSNLISGDGGAYAYIAQYITEKRSIPSHLLNFVANVSEDNVTYFPISYPLLSFFVMSVFYAMGGVTWLYFYPAVCADIITFVVYIFVSKLSNKPTGVVAASMIFLHHVILDTFSLSIRMEPLLMVFFFLAFYFYSTFVKTNGRKQAIYTGFALGLALATKQQAFLFILFLFFHSILYQAYRIFAHKAIEAKVIKNYFLMYGFATLVSAPFLVYLALDTGTLDYPPGNRFWFLKPRWTVDPKSVNYLSQFWPVEQASLQEKAFFSLQNTFYPLHPGFHVVVNPLRYIVFVFLGLGILYLSKQDRLTLSMFITFIIGELFFFVMSGAPPRYFIFAFFLVMILLALGLSQLYSLFNRFLLVLKPRIFRIGRIPIAVAFFIGLNLVAVATPGYLSFLYGRSYHVTVMGPKGPIDRTLQYKLAGEWIRENTPKDSFFLASRDVEAAYYFKRSVTWVNLLGMSRVIDILYSRDLQKTINYLREYGIDYIVYDPLFVYVDRFPPGLSDFLRYGDPHFKLVYENELLKIYKIIYDESIPIYPSYLDGVSSVSLSIFEGLDDGVFYPNVRMIFAHPRGSWNLTSNGLMTSAEYNYVAVSLSSELDKDEDGYVDNPIIITIKGYVNKLEARDQYNWYSLEKLIITENVTEFRIQKAYYTKVEQEAWIERYAKIVHSYIDIRLVGRALIESITISFQSQ